MNDSDLLIVVATVVAGLSVLAGIVVTHILMGGSW